MYKVVSIFLIIISTSCNYSFNTSNNNNNDNEILISQHHYLCAEHTIAANEYKRDVHLQYSIQLVSYTNNIIKTNSVLNLTNSAFKDANLSFSLEPVVIKPKLNLNRFYSYTNDFLKVNFRYGNIVIVVVPDEVKLKEDNGEGWISGASDGVPDIRNTSLGKPVLFIRESSLYTNILIHELGHTFGLLHIFKNNDVINKGHNCDTGDRIADTTTLPADGTTGSKTCKFYPSRTWNNPYNLTDLEIEKAVSNYESYSDPRCMNHFSEGQIQEIRKMCEVNPLLIACQV